MRILYVQPGRGIGGSKISLSQIIRANACRQKSQVVLSSPVDHLFKGMHVDELEKIHELYLPTWIKGEPMRIGAHFTSFLSKLSKGWYVWPAIQIARIIKKEQIDIVHTNNGICPVGAFAAFLTGKPHIWHIREPIGQGRQYPLSIGDRASARLFHSLSKRIVCNSQYTASFFQTQETNVRIIYNGIEINKFNGANPQGVKLRRSLRLPLDCLVIGMAASIRVEWKEHKVFLKVAAELLKSVPECYFVVFGGDSNLEATPYTRELASMAANLQLGERIVWADHIDDVPAMMHSMDVMIHPAVREGSGRVIMEAMAAGIPVVAYRSGGVKELVQDGITGYLNEPGDWMALVESAKRLLDDKGLYKAMRERSKIYAAENFSLEKTMRAIYNLYQEVLS